MNKTAPIVTSATPVPEQGRRGRSLRRPPAFAVGYDSPPAESRNLTAIRWESGGSAASFVRKLLAGDSRCYQRRAGSGPNGPPDRTKWYTDNNASSVSPPHAESCILTIKVPMSQRAAWIICALLLCGPGVVRSALAEVEPSPLAEMRAAAESLAELEPEPAHRGGAALLPGGAKVLVGARKDVLRDAVREAVRSEVAKERVSVGSNSAGRSGSAGKSDNSAESGNSASGQAHSTAAQAQQAKRNNDVSLQHRQNLGKGPPLIPPGQERAPGLGTHPK